MPLCQRLPGLSSITNQTNMSTRASFRAIAIACGMYAACCASVTPFGSPGFVSLPYSVIQIRMPLRRKATSRSFSNRGMLMSVTFG